MGPRRCVLHIGICKTGTTSIQYGLAANRALLAQAGVVVPRTLGPTHNHRHLTLLAVDANSEAAEREWEVLRGRDPGLAACATLEQARHWVERALAAELAAVGPDQWVVFSCEQLSQRLLRDSEVWRLRDALERLGFGTVRVVVYLREQVGLVLSWDSMEVLAGHRSTPFEEPTEQFNHQQLLERWERVWGREALMVRTYARACLAQGDIVRDFETHALPLPPDQLWLAEQPWRNARLGRRSLWLLRQANRWLPRLLPEEGVNPWRMRLLQASQPRWIRGRPAQASPQQIARWRSRYAASNQWVDAQFGTQLEASFGNT